MSQTSEDSNVTQTPAETEPISSVDALNDAVSDSSRPRRKVRAGLVISDKMDKTVVVSVESRVKHPLYGKVVRKSSKLKAHDEANEAGVGDRVLVMETRPLSATKRWRLVRVLEKAK